MVLSLSLPGTPHPRPNFLFQCINSFLRNRSSSLTSSEFTTGLPRSSLSFYVVSLPPHTSSRELSLPRTSLGAEVVFSYHSPAPPLGPSPSVEIAVLRLQ